MAVKGRLYYLDNLKVFLIVLVIMHHVGQAYGTTGGSWYYGYPGVRSTTLGLFFLFNASFFMGLFFFISGYFFPGSLDRHGTGKFITDKLVRFGIPIVFASLTILPALEYAKSVHYVGRTGFKDFYFGQWLRNAPQITGPDTFNIAHLWFIEHLLIYSLLYVLFMTAMKRFSPVHPYPAERRVRLYAIVPVILTLGVITHLMRISWGFPIDRWIGLLGFIQMEPAHIPQYLSLFVIGILAYRWSLLDSFTATRNILWLVPGVGIYVITVVQIYSSGRNVDSFMWEYREALLCVGVCIGLLAFFKTFLNRAGQTMQVLSENVFGTYILHVPVVVALQYAFDPLQADAVTLFAVVSFLSIPASFLLSVLVRSIPGMKRII